MKNKKPLKDRLALVTGASRGIGRGWALWIEREKAQERSLDAPPRFVLWLVTTIVSGVLLLAHVTVIVRHLHNYLYPAKPFVEWLRRWIL